MGLDQTHKCEGLLGCPFPSVECKSVNRSDEVGMMGPMECLESMVE